MDIVFVILHYMVDEETCKCIKYIKENIDTNNYKIIVVDNASPNGSFSVLKEKYENDSKIVLLKNEENLGFANGNNVGFLYAKKNLNPEFIVMMNDDAYLLDHHLLQHLNAEYSAKPFAVAGPLIISGGGNININPTRHRIYTAEECDYIIKRKKTDIFWTRLYLYEALKFCRRIKRKLFRIFHIPKKESQYLQNNNTNNNDLPPFLCYSENVELHGCCLIFSKRYIDKWDGLDHRTYMYCEESILYAHMMLDGERTVYMPNITVFHKGSASTDSVIKKRRNKLLFEFTNSLDSYRVLEEILNGK